MTTCAFYSDHPIVLATLHEHQARYQEWHHAVSEFAARYPNHSVLQTDGGNIVWVSGLVDGKDGGGGTRVSPGDGWRIGNRADWRCWVPDKRTRAGKQLAKEIDGLQVVGLAKLPGMPVDVYARSRMHRHGVFVDAGGGVDPGAEDGSGTCDRVWVNWGCEAELVMKERGYDPALWTPGKLSQYYAAREKVEEAEEAAHA